MNENCPICKDPALKSAGTTEVGRARHRPSCLSRVWLVENTRLMKRSLVTLQRRDLIRIDTFSLGQSGKRMKKE